MNKKRAIILFITGVLFILSGCKPVVTDIDCESYPYHVDCIVTDDNTDDNSDVVDDTNNDQVDNTDGIDDTVNDQVVDDTNNDQNNDEQDIDPLNYIEIYYMNDFHGAILPNDDQIGLSGISNFLDERKETNPENVLFLAGGDMLQGSALSNYYDGQAVIEIFNEMGLDAFTVGNHEFDWGFDVVQRYFDNDLSNGEAEFPLLGANIFLKGTDIRPDYVEPYTILEKGQFKIGIIGTIGYGLESSIAVSRVEDFEFRNPIDYIEDAAIELRTEHEVDLVLVVAHDSGGALNSQVEALEGDANVDMVFNGHSHSEYDGFINEMAYMQSGSLGETVGYVRVTMMNDQVSIIMDQYDVYESEYFWQEDEDIEAIVDQYATPEWYAAFTDPLLISDSYISQYALSIWIAEIMRQSTGADIGFQNAGGTRVSVSDETPMSLSTLYQIWPFDNIVKTVYLTGAQINTLKTALIYSTDIDTFESDQLYLVATNDYVFDKDYNPFIFGEDPFNTNLNLRDLAYEELLLQSDIYDTFNVDQLILTTKKDYE
jgi:5'-nucleotidase/UDP-sugar diphosphatase